MGRGLFCLAQRKISSCMKQDHCFAWARSVIHTHTHTHTYVATCILYECTHIWKGWPHLSFCNNLFPLEMKKKLTCRSNT